MIAPIVDGTVRRASIAGIDGVGAIVMREKRHENLLIRKEKVMINSRRYEGFEEESHDADIIDEWLAQILEDERELRARLAPDCQGDAEEGSQS